MKRVTVWRLLSSFAWIALAIGVATGENFSCHFASGRMAGKQNEEWVVTFGVEVAGHKIGNYRPDIFILR